MTDPITIAVLQNRLNAIAEEMGEAMLRTAYSQILNSSRDFSIALIDARCRLVAQADHIPVHVGAMPWAVKALVERFPSPAPNDVYLLNDPYRGGSHLPDLTVFVPVFAGPALMFWSVVRAHHSDVGGATHGAYNPAATEIWHEGLRLPPMRLTENGVLREDLLEMLALNVRHPRDFRGDLAAQIGAARLGEQRLDAVIHEFGRETLLAAVETMLDGAERHARQIVAQWADGVYLGEAVLDDDGFGKTDIVIRARVTKRGSNVAIDLTDSDPQVTGFINSSHANTQSAVAMAFAFLLDPDIAKNEGAFRPLTVSLREGTIVWAKEGAPVTMCTSHCSNEIIEAIIVALAQACPERAMGGWGRRLRIALNGTDPRTGRRFIWHMFQARPGGGGSVAGDGYSTIGEWHSAGGIKFGSIEVAETRFPLVFETHEYRPGSAGDGRHRGGYGGDMRLRVEAEDARANTAGEGVVHGARGIGGGQDGASHDYTLLAPNAGPRKLKSKEIDVPVPRGSVIHVLSGGGGGWGDPAARDPGARAADEAEGLTLAGAMSSGQDRCAVEIVLTDQPTDADQEVIQRGLADYNALQVGYRDWRPLAALLRDPATGRTVGGMTGRTSYGLLFIDLVYLPESVRGQDIGRRLLAMMEAEAMRRGCKAGFLLTITYQAPGFYARHGWSEFGRIDCDPAGTARVFMSKMLRHETVVP